MISCASRNRRCSEELLVAESSRANATRDSYSVDQKLAGTPGWKKRVGKIIVLVVFGGESVPRSLLQCKESRSAAQGNCSRSWVL